MLLTTVFIIAGYTKYISIAKELPFKRRFLEMAIISIGVAIISFGIGHIVSSFLGV
jgi:VIT1/CCC1 family predicted Fe2+/Mn2+ transporter